MNHGYAQGYNTWVTLGSTGLPEVLEVGEKKNMTITASLTHPEKHTTSWTKAISVMDDFTKDMQKAVSMGNILFVPYVPEIAFYITGTDEEYMSNRWNTYTPTLTMGLVYDGASKTKTVSIKNIAPTAPATIEEISLDGIDFSVDFTAPKTLAAGESMDVVITLANENPGVFVNKLTVKSTGLDDLTANIVAAVPVDGMAHTDFEDGTAPVGFILSGSWEYCDTPDEYAIEGHKKTLSSKGVASEMITSKMSVEEGEVLMIGGYAENDYYNVEVEYSADRSEWTSAYKSANAEYVNKPSEDKGTGEYLQRSFISVDLIPAGEWYVKIIAKDFNINDIYGFTALPVESELVVKSIEVPTSATVNNPYIVNLELSNAGNALEASDYTVTLFLDDKEFGVAKSEDIAAGETLAFELSGMIHEAGEYEAYVEVAYGEIALTTDPVTVNVKEESTEGETLVVGPQTGSTRNNGGPVSNVQKYQVEYLQTKARIEKYAPDLKAGSKIGSLTFYGTYSGTDPMESDMTVYVKNITEEKLNTTKVVKKASLDKEPEELTEYDYTEVRAYSDVETMEKVFEGKVVINATSPAGALFTIDFEEAFKYDGNNIDILLLVNTKNPSYYSAPQYNNESVSGYDCIYYSKDTDFPTEPDHLYNEVITNYNYMPTMGFGTTVDVAVVSGTVTHATSKEPLADVAITLESPENVIYKTVTDENGEYTVNVLQPDKQYKVKASKDKLDDYESEEYLDLSGLSATHHFTMTGVTTGVESIQAGVLRVKVVAGGILISAENDADVTVYDLLGRTVLRIEGFAGEKMVSLPAGIYVVNNRKVAVK